MSADAFVLAATEGRRTRAEALLAGQPEIERDPWARLVRGRSWEGDANEPGGPRRWAPLLYVCHSCFASPGLAAELLARGADRTRVSGTSTARCPRSTAPRASCTTPS